MRDTPDYRRAVRDLHHTADLYQTLPYNVALTPAQLAQVTSRLQLVIHDLQRLLNEHYPTPNEST